MFAVVVSLGMWRATVHYTDCPYYAQATRRNVPIPRKMKVVLCTRCRPTTEDLFDHTPFVDWFEYSPAPLAGVRMRQVDLHGDALESVVGRRSLGLGKKARR